MTRAQIADAAWAEFIVARAYSTGAPPSHNVRSRRRARAWWATRSQPPSWFVKDEIGYDVGSGPSLEWTCKTLAAANAKAVKMLGRDAPRRTTWPRK